MKTVLKKAGIVVAAAAAGLLALSPLAFAGDYESDSGNHHHHGGDDSDHDHDHDHGANCHQDNSWKDKADGVHAQGGLVNIQDTTVQVPIQACNNSVLEGVLGILSKDQRNSDDHG